jgi:hypothetical protein
MLNCANAIPPINSIAKIKIAFISIKLVNDYIVVAIIFFKDQKNNTFKTYIT